jgi:hypothetical protein
MRTTLLCIGVQREFCSDTRRGQYYHESARLRHAQEWPETILKPCAGLCCFESVRICSQPNGPHGLSEGWEWRAGSTLLSSLCSASQSGEEASVSKQTGLLQYLWARDGVVVIEAASDLDDLSGRRFHEHPQSTRPFSATRSGRSTQSASTACAGSEKWQRCHMLLQQSP